MSKVAQRFLVFLIGIPSVVIIVLFLPFCKNLVLNLTIIVFSIIGAVEFAAMLEKKQLLINRVEAVILGSLAPLAGTLALIFSNQQQWIFPFFIMSGASWILLSGIFSRPQNMGKIAGRIVAGFSIIIYPGLFLYWLVKMSSWEKSGIIILIFLLLVILSDSSAWAAGMLFGKGNRGIIAISPNKSIAGFIGVIVGAIIVSSGAALIVPSVFVLRHGSSVMPAVIFLGLCTSAAGALGDLAESAIKRSCDLKDSGNIMLGRGGVLDSIDSISVAAPVFYSLYNLLFINL